MDILTKMPIFTLIIILDNEIGESHSNTTILWSVVRIFFNWV